MDVRGAAICTVERLKIAERLRHLKDPKRVRGVWYGHVVVRRSGHDHEDAVVRAALVQLTRRVQVAWSIAERRRAVVVQRDSVSDSNQPRSKSIVVRWQVGEQGEIDGRFQLVEDR